MEDGKKKISELNGNKQYQTLSALNFLMNSILICNCHFQIFDVCNILKEYTYVSYLTIFPCSLEMRHQHIVQCLVTEVCQL
jgi:hypothetical protein